MLAQISNSPTGVPGEMGLPLPATTTIFRPPQASHFRSSSPTIFLPLYSSRNRLRCSATTLASPQQRNETEVENKKYDLLKAIQDTQRGLVTTPNQRSEIEESLVDLESYEAGDEAIDLVKLDGTWRLQYTSASDVLVLLDTSSRLPFFQVGQIFQKFECEDQNDGGYVRNVVRWSIPSLLEENEGATLLVSAKFSVVSRRNIYLQFEEIALQNINISEELQALIAPALLPRSFFSLQSVFFFWFDKRNVLSINQEKIQVEITILVRKILQAIRTFKAQVPVSNTSPGRRSVGGLYYLSYLDTNMLVGRAVGGGGVFVFTRAQNIL